ncbi:MAG TPA: PQQ-dependent sugar dehydrogenase [Gammaproteobacteria bacterium]
MNTSVARPVARLRLPLGAVVSVLAIAVPVAGSAQTPASVVEMTSAFRFAPETVEIPLGGTVEWRNVSNVVHTVTADPALAADPTFVSLPAGASTFDSGAIGPGGVFTQTFTVPGRYDYFCVPHQGFGMRGTVIVVEPGGAPDGEPGLADPIPETITRSSIGVRLVPVASGLNAPNAATAAPGVAGRLFVADQTGQVYAVDLATGQASLFLDVSARLVPLGAFGPESYDERGLLGLAFHPDYAANGLLYTYTSEPAGVPADFSTLAVGEASDHQSVILEWHVPAPADPASVPDAAAVREVIRIDQPQFNHNAGALLFDAEKMLLIALGDGGGDDDQGPGHVAGGNGQHVGDPLGAILRIDPLGTDAANGRYGIPATNPFVGRTDAVPEIYAFGFRNPFRMSIDPDTGELWVGDSGQNDVEEIDVVQPGANYGWSVKEGTFFFDPNGDEPGFVTTEPATALPPELQLIDPVAQYDHDEGVAIIGGHVYRGQRVPALAGLYVFGDYGSDMGGRLLVLEADGVIRALAVEGGFAKRVLGFGRDADGESYVLANDTGTPFGGTGVVLRIEGIQQELPIPY